MNAPRPRPAAQRLSASLLLLAVCCALVAWHLVELGTIPGAILFLVAGLIAGGAIQRRTAWARNSALLLFAIGIGASVLLLRSGFTWPAMAQAISGGLGIVTIWRTFAPALPASQPLLFENTTEEEPQAEQISLVALLREPQYLDATMLAHWATIAWDTTVGTEDDANEHAYAVGDSPQFILKKGPHFFLTLNVDEPYFDDLDDVAEQMDELRIRHAIAEHRGWMAIDLVNSEQSRSLPADIYHEIGRLFAEILDDDCLAILCPQTGAIYPWHPGIIGKLCSSDPLAALEETSFSPVLRVDENDPRLLIAVQTARRCWPEFVAAFEERTDEQNFSVKAPFSDGQATEFIWVRVTATENGVIYGTLGNEPVQLSHLRLHDRVRVKVDELNDWLYTDVAEGLQPPQQHGGFTLDVINQVAAETTRRRIRRD